MPPRGSCAFWLVLFLLLGSAWAQAGCTPGERSLELASFGTVYFRDLASEGEQLRLSGGICADLTGAGGQLVRLEAESLYLNGGDPPVVRAWQVRLVLQDWTVEAQLLERHAEQFHLTSVRLSGEGVVGSAAAAVYDPSSGRVSFEAFEAVARHYRLAGASAELLGGQLRLEDALVTTCTCTDDPLYLIRAPGMDVDLLSEEVSIRDGTLYLGSVPISLASELLLSEEALADLAIPVRLERLENGGNESTLAFHVPQLVLAPGLGLQLGLSNLDGPEALEGIFLITLEQAGARATVGKAWQGPQADVELRQELTPWLEAQFGVHNRPWPQADFLHQGFVRLEAHEALRPAFGGDLQLHAAAFAAVSTQHLDMPTLDNQAIDMHTVSSPRLGTEYGFHYSAPSALGSWHIAHVGALTHYPGGTDMQYGLRFEPGWQAQLGPLSLALNYTLQLSNGVSPFSTRLDRLVPMSQLEGEARVATGTAELDGELRLRARYDAWAPAAGGEIHLYAQAGVALAGWRLHPSFELDASGLLWPDAAEADAFIAANLALSREHWEFSLRSRYGLHANASLELLELAASVPLQIGSVRLQPFLAVDVAGALQGGSVALSGHGLELEWRHCCGVMNLGYRQHGERFSTTLSLGLD